MIRPIRASIALMRATGGLRLLLIAVLVPSSLALASDAKVHWDYSAERGPAKWASLSKAFKTCAAGATQSPIDIPSVPATLASGHAYAYKPVKAMVANNGHTIVVNVAEGNVLKMGNLTYKLLQFHFHTPSENKLNGRQFPMEIHLVHANANGALAVVGIMVEPGGANPVIDKLPTPSAKGKPQPIAGPIDVNLMFPANRSHYAFTGSLTTPPCSESVRWFVAATPVKASAAAIARFRAAMGKNNRPVNPLNARAIVRVR